MKIKKRRLIVWGMIFIYIAAALAIALLLQKGTIQLAKPLPQNITPTLDVTENLQAAQRYTGLELVRNDGFVKLYNVPGNATYPGENQTNSEAVTYYLLQAAQSKDKQTVDWTLDFIETHMMHPQGDYIMWRLEDDLSVKTDGGNIASDADIRAIKALLIAKEEWGDQRYTTLINRLATALENVAITQDNYLAPYAGYAGNTSWTANEVWLSYADFEVFQALANERGEPWISVLNNTKQAYLDSQIRVGFYNPSLNEEREFGNGIDGGAYSINSLWMMVRAAQSGDDDLLQSANKSVQFYKQRYATDAELYAIYTANGDPLSAYDTPWVYALVARAAVELGQNEFASQLIDELLMHQIQDPRHPLYGAIPENADPIRISQFTMHESILTLQSFAIINEQNTELSSKTTALFWKNRMPIMPREQPQDPIETQPEPPVIIEQDPTLTQKFLQDYKENVAYYSFLYREPKYLETVYFIRGDMLKIISEAHFFELTEDRTVTSSRLQRETDRLLEDIRNDEVDTMSYIWYNLTTTDAHGCYIRQTEATYTLDPGYREIKDNCITYKNKPFQKIHRFIHFNDLPTLPHQWLERYEYDEPISFESGVVYRDVEQDAQHTAYILVYENDDGTKTRMTLQAQYKLPLLIEIYDENRTINTFEYDYFRANDRQITVWHESFLQI